jgi:hypothetical protein
MKQPILLSGISGLLEGFANPYCVLLSLLLIGLTATAGDIAVSLDSRPGSSGGRTVTLTTNTATLDYVNWDSPSKTAGGRETLQAFLKNDSVVFIHEWLTANGGPLDHGATNRVVGTSNLPQKLTLGPWTATVFRLEEKNRK